MLREPISPFLRHVCLSVILDSVDTCVLALNVASKLLAKGKAFQEESGLFRILVCLWEPRAVMLAFGFERAQRPALSAWGVEWMEHVLGPAAVREPLSRKDPS